MEGTVTRDEIGRLLHKWMEGSDELAVSGSVSWTNSYFGSIFENPVLKKEVMK